MNKRDWQRCVARWQLRHFAEHEFLVRCDQPGNEYPPAELWPNMEGVAKLLDELRERLDVPIIITSAYRSPAYNRKVGGVENSQHMQFCALDFSCRLTYTAWRTLKAWRDNGRFKGGMGYYSSFIHVDMRGQNRTWGFR